MKLQEILPLLLVLLAMANDDEEQSNGSLRGSAIRDSTPLLVILQGKGVLRPILFPTEEVTAPTEAPISIFFDLRLNDPQPISAPEPMRPVLYGLEPSFPTQPRPNDPQPVSAPEPMRPILYGLEPSFPTQPPVPPIRQQALDVNGNMCGMSTSGTVILHGGIFNYEDPLSDSLGQAIVREMRTNSENRLMDPLVFLPGARRDVSDEDEITFENQWQNIMAPGVAFSVLHADNREPEFTNVADAGQADTDGFVRPLKDAMGVFLPGGRQWRLIDAYKYTQTEEELWNVLRRGGVIAGTSAGAAVMASFMPRGDPEGSATFVAEREWYQHGFGFVSNIAVDSHVSIRGRENAMYEALNARLANRKLLGIGLNENTMAIIKGRYLQVRGDRVQDSVVRIYDCSRIDEFDTCTFENAPYTELTQGNWYDLCARQQLGATPSSSDLDEDLGQRSVTGAYKRPWKFGRDFKAGNSENFLCSGRVCKFFSNPIVVDTADGYGNIVRITGEVSSRGSGFIDSDQLVVRYKMDNEKWERAYDSSVFPGPSISYAFAVPKGKHTLQLNIDAKTSMEEGAEWQVKNLKIQ